MPSILRRAAPEEGAVGDKSMPPLARHGTAQKGGNVCGDAQEYLEDDVVGEQRRRRFHDFHLRKLSWSSRRTSAVRISVNMYMGHIFGSFSFSDLFN